MNGWLLLLVTSCVALGLGLRPVRGEAEGRGDARPVWGDWVVAADDADAGASVLLRRITPKSVFVAPTFTGCSEGYRQDSLGRCVKLVKVNQQSQWNFFLERLNSMYAPSSTSKNPQKESGPFHINLPLASENSQEDLIVKKRLPPQVTQVKTTQPPTKTTTTTSTTTPEPQTSPLPTTTMQQHESTTLEPPLSTIVDPSEVTSTEKEVVPSTEPTSETRRDTATESLTDFTVMLGDQPYNEEIVDESFDTPKNKENISQLQEKPFLIIVTNPTVTERSDTTSTSFLPTGEEEEIEEVTSTTETTTEGNSKYTTDFFSTTEESSSKSRDPTGTPMRPTVTNRPGCEDKADFEDCGTVELEVASIDSNPSSLPNLPLLDPSSQVRFPSESFVPVRKTQSFVRFPDVTRPHEDRPSSGFWWPSWQIRQYPGIHGWPESSDQIHGSTDQVIQRKYSYGTSWSSPMAWQRRFLQRD